MAKGSSRKWTKYDVFNAYMILVTFLGTAIVFVQASVIIENKSAENVSLPSYIMLLIVSLSYMALGMFRSELLITLYSALVVTGSILAIIATVAYQPNFDPTPFAV